MFNFEKHKINGIYCGKDYMGRNKFKYRLIWNYFWVCEEKIMVDLKKMI